jgi:hypothetical protein
MQKKISKHFLKATEYQQPKVKDSLPRSWGKIVDGEQTPVITQGEHLLVIGTLPDLMQRMAANTHDISVPIENIAIPLNNSYEFIQLETSATIS